MFWLRSVAADREYWSEGGIANAFCPSAPQQAESATLKSRWRSSDILHAVTFFSGKTSILTGIPLLYC